jgi:hypothetical protein
VNAYKSEPMFSWMVVPQDDGSCQLVDTNTDELVATVHASNSGQALGIAALMSASSMLLAAIIEINYVLQTSKEVISLEDIASITSPALEKITAEAGVEGN